MTKTRRSRRFLMKRLKPAFLLILLAVLAVFSGATYLVHGIQVQRKASSLLDRARLAEAGNDLEKTEQALGQYLRLEREHGPTWKWYARVVDQRDSDRRGRERVFLVHEEALRYNPGDLELERRCADLALELGRYKEAQSHLMSLLEKADKDSQSQTAAAVARAELEDLLGQCSRGLTSYEDAEKWFEKSIKHGPGRLACYDRLARLRRTELRRIEAADRTIRDMVAKNPQAGRAYAYRWRYAQEFAPPAEAADIPKALKLAPDDPEVLLTAAIASEQKADPAGARPYWEKGLKLDPGSVPLSLGLARLEVRENHPDRAEAVLRQAYRVNPSLDLALELANTLIIQDKVDGKDQAGEYIALLRSAGLGDTYVRYLEARILFQRQQWAEAIRPIEDARNALNFDPRLVAQLNLMLAECYGRVGAVEQRLSALRQVAEGERSPDVVRIELTQALGQAGKLDQAIAMLLPLADRRPELRLDLVRLLIQKTSRQPADQRNWQEVERALVQAEKALPRETEKLVLLHIDLLVAQDRLADALSLLSSAQAKDPRNLRYRLVLARVKQRQGDSAAALRILEQAEKDLGPSLDLQLARLDHWGFEGGDAAKAAVAKLAETPQQFADADRAPFLDGLAAVEVRLGEPALARRYWRELAALRPANVEVRAALLDLALQAGDHADELDLVAKIRAIEGENGTLWRFGQASCILDQVRRGLTGDLEAAQKLADEIAQRRPDWWGSSVLLAELAELEGHTDDAIASYTRAIEQGNTKLVLARRLVGLLNQKEQFDQVDRVVKILSDRGLDTGELTIATALSAIRQQDYDRGIALARRAFPESSTNSGDHLFLGQFYLAAGRPQEAGKELRRAVELGPGVPIIWVTYVQYLAREKQVAQARSAIEAARKALPANQVNVALAQCYALTGDTKQAESMIQAALQSPGCDLTTIRVATDLYINLGRFDQVEPILDKLRAPTIKVTPEVLAWANRTRSQMRSATGRLDDLDSALALLEQNLKTNPSSLEDNRLKAVFLAMRTSGRPAAIKILEPLDQANQLGAFDQFLLARLYLGERLEDRYRSEMLEILDGKTKNPQHLGHFIGFLIDRGELAQVDRWLAELKRVEPQGPRALELEARLLKARKRDQELVAMLQERGRQIPDQIGVVARLLDRYGFVGEAEQAYKTFIGRNPNEPERALALVPLLVRQNRITEAVEILQKTWKTCKPEAVAATALALVDAPSGDANLKRQVEGWLTEAIQKSPAAAPRLRPRLASLYWKEGRYAEAEALNRQIVAADPDNVESLNNLAWELLLRDPSRFKEALDLVNRAIEKAGTLTSLADTRAVALIRGGQYDQAAQELRTAQEIDPKNLSLALHLAWA
ncbi:MAG TPA: tetratricopeptide repeat protein, partial [Isosphaeraceae bacterium]|nr:tetratricopeptide repeat protein [Isosphaeraceae bacterium]